VSAQNVKYLQLLKFAIQRRKVVTFLNEPFILSATGPAAPIKNSRIHFILAGIFK